MDPNEQTFQFTQGSELSFGYGQTELSTSQGAGGLRDDWMDMFDFGACDRDIEANNNSQKGRVGDPYNLYLPQI